LLSIVQPEMPERCQPVGQDCEGLVAWQTDSTSPPEDVPLIIVALTESSSVADDGVAVADRTSPGQKIQWDHSGSILSFAAGSAIKRIKVGGECNVLRILRPHYLNIESAASAWKSFQHRARHGHLSRSPETYRDNRFEIRCQSPVPTADRLLIKQQVSLHTVSDCVHKNMPGAKRVLIRSEVLVGFWYGFGCGSMKTVSRRPLTI
jgi:hypothetical protein